jgi:hypothetical protein
MIKNLIWQIKKTEKKMLIEVQMYFTKYRKFENWKKKSQLLTNDNKRLIMPVK